MAENQWKKPKDIEGNLHWKKGLSWSEVYFQVSANTIFLYPKNRKDGNQILNQISITQVDEVIEIEARFRKRCFQIVLKTGVVEQFKCPTMDVQWWIDNLRHAVKFWTDKENLQLQKKGRQRKVTLEGLDDAVQYVKKHRVFFTLWNGEMIGLLVNATSSFTDIYQRLFSLSCEASSCCVCKIRHQSCDLWAVDTTGTARRAAKKEILTDLDKAGNSLFVMEHHQKLLVVHFRDYSYEILPAPAVITAKEVLKLDQISSKLNELGCLDPGLFLREKSGSAEAQFCTNDHPFKYQVDGKMIVARSKRIRINSLKKSDYEKRAELRWNEYLGFLKRQQTSIVIGETHADQIQKSCKMDEELCFIDDHFALNNDSTGRTSDPPGMQARYKQGVPRMDEGYQLSSSDQYCTESGVNDGSVPGCSGTIVQRQLSLDTEWVSVHHSPRNSCAKNNPDATNATMSVNNVTSVISTDKKDYDVVRRESSDNNRTENSDVRRSSDNNSTENRDVRRSSDNNRTENSDVRRSSDNNFTENSDVRRSLDNNSTENSDVRRSLDNNSTENSDVRRSLDNNFTENSDVRSVEDSTGNPTKKDLTYSIYSKNNQDLTNTISDGSCTENNHDTTGFVESTTTCSVGKDEQDVTNVGTSTNSTDETIVPSDVEGDVTGNGTPDNVVTSPSRECLAHHDVVTVVTSESTCIENNNDDTNITNTTCVENNNDVKHKANVICVQHSDDVTHIEDSDRAKSDVTNMTNDICAKTSNDVINMINDINMADDTNCPSLNNENNSLSKAKADINDVPSDFANPNKLLSPSEKRISRIHSDGSVFRTERKELSHSPENRFGMRRTLSDLNVHYSCTAVKTRKMRSESEPDLLDRDDDDAILKVSDVFIPKESSDESDHSDDDVCRPSKVPGPTWMFAKRVEECVRKILVVQKDSSAVERMIAVYLSKVLFELLNHGLKKNFLGISFFSKASNVWDICQHVCKITSVGAEVIERIREGSTEEKFHRFTHECIRKKILSRWFEVLSSEKVQKRIMQFYQPSAVVLEPEHSKAMEHLKIFLDKLNVLKLKALKPQEPRQNHDFLYSYE